MLVLLIFLLTFSGGVISGRRHSRHKEPSCPYNEHYVRKDTSCQKTCGNRLLPGENVLDCKPFTGCVCDSGYLRLYDNATGPCIPRKKCAPIPKKCGKNEMPTSCKTVCPPQTCKSMYLASNCQPSDCEPGCDCIDDYLRNEDGVCVPVDDCYSPSRKKCKDKNAIYKKCPNPCPLTCDQPEPRPCSKLCLANGCECENGFILNKIGGKCIRPDDCPEPLCQKHERYVMGDCNFVKTCGNRLIPGAPTETDEPFTGCLCDTGYVRKYDNATGPCIPKKQCPPIPKKCGENEERTSCSIVCPPQSCESIYTSYSCTPGDCEPGCNCLDGFLRNSAGVCIPSEKCPANQQCSDPNASPQDCPRSCQPTCDQPDTSDIICIDVCLPSGCVCNPGYILDKTGGTCIPEDQCPATLQNCSDPNASPQDCPSYCQPTCDQPDTSGTDCIDACLPSGCVCNPGYILDKTDGTCIPEDQCPATLQNCSDPNASPQDCPSYCQPTCDQPDTSGIDCIAACLPSGCVCNSGYILDKTGGKCIPEDQCPAISVCGENEEASDCKIVCPPQSCESLYVSYLCALGPCTPGCNCINGYLRNSSNVCIPSDQCSTDSNQCGDPNALRQQCASTCRPTCEEPDTSKRICSLSCRIGGCVCKPGYILDKPGGKCIKEEDCPTKVCSDPNASPQNCPSYCQPTCGQPNNRDILCVAGCLPSGCVCNPGYILDKADGICVKIEDCPITVQNCSDPNASPQDCPSYCQPTCDQPDTSGIICVDACLPSGCVCKSGYILDKADGMCIKKEDCPGNQQCSDPNASPSTEECTSPCQPTCDQPDTSDIICIQSCQIGACVCNPGYILDKSGGTCIKIKECPGNKQCSDPNASPRNCPSSCQPTCEQPDTRDIICNRACLPSGCVCNQEYILDKKGGTCIRPEDCPGGSPECSGNKTYTNCFFNCLNMYCPVDDSTGIIVCKPAFPCPPGCACLDGYLMLSDTDRRCILSSECPPVECTRPNEEWDASPSNCNLERCEDMHSACDDSSTGRPRCVCKSGYYRNNNDICVPASECDNQGCNGDRNATSVICPGPNPPTCAEPYPSNNQQDKQEVEEDGVFTCLSIGCECKPGFVLSEGGGQCINPRDCPDNQGCNGDSNATIKECPNACPATCADPDTRNKPCPAICLGLGCECKRGFIFSKQGGQCIDPKDCPGGIPDCGENKTYVDCFIGCPPSYCPTTDSRAVIACSVTYNCPPGCACKSGYLMLSYEDPQCVLSSECPPVNCTRPNEVWAPSPSNCNRERCEDMDTVCVDSSSTGPPKCVCKSGYYRNENDICVPASECDQGCNGDSNATSVVCPKSNQPTCAKPNPIISTRVKRTCLVIGCECKPGFILSERGGQCIDPMDCPGCNGDPNAIFSECTSYCPRTCDESDNERVCIALCGPPGCVCKPDYVYSKEKGKCVKPTECPKGCKGDVNAIYSDCPSYCPLTCDNPDNSGKGCVAACAPPGCVCKPGYLKNNKGKCVLPEGCPGGIPDCGANKTYVPCKVGCPTNFCPTTDIRAMVACSMPYPCPAGCACNKGYLFQDDIDYNCILSSDCAPVNCTRPNEIWDPSPSNCYMERCEDRHTKCENNYPSPPRCVCKPGYYRNDKDICIPASKCPAPPKKCPIPKKCIRTCASPNPPNCSYKPAATNREGCECMEGYILSEVGGMCIRIEECPVKLGCNGDPHAKPKQCPLPWPSTCDRPNASPCEKMCEPIGCECVPGYILSEKGKCILPNDCPGGNPCGENEEFRQCKDNCPNEYCPVDDSRGVVICDSFPFCLPGCACKLNHRRLSREDKRCIVASDCPPVNCTRQNEVFNGCPSDCFSGFCEDKEYQDVVCNTLLLNCQPKCICKRDFFRNASDICVPASECPPTCSVSNECLRTCASPNPPNCPYEPSETNIDGCSCMEGYILSDIGGKCIRIKECPSDGSCNGDPNARPKRCPVPCPSTCKSPEAIPCRKRCDPIGCECKPGYILSNNNGQCIKPDKCPGGNPCGPNANFVPCKNGCPTDYCPVDDNRGILICEPTPEEFCLSGCRCKLNHKWLSREDKRCIVSSDCPKVNCTRPNEVWNSCPSACLRENCKDVNNQPTKCQTLVLNCNPRCVCKKNFFRNKEDICVPPCNC